jgi:hypothetical protein
MFSTEAEYQSTFLAVLLSLAGNNAICTFYRNLFFKLPKFLNF